MGGGDPGEKRVGSVQKGSGEREGWKQDFQGGNKQ